MAVATKNAVPMIIVTAPAANLTSVAAAIGTAMSVVAETAALTLTFMAAGVAVGAWFPKQTSDLYY